MNTNAKPTRARTTAPAAPVARAAANTLASRGAVGVPLARLLWRAHSGHFWPTGVDTMQRGQIGAPQLEQLRRVSTPGWARQVLVSGACSVDMVPASVP